MDDLLYHYAGAILLARESRNHPIRTLGLIVVCAVAAVILLSAGQKRRNRWLLFGSGVALGLACTSPPCDRGDSSATYLTSILRTYDGGQTWAAPSRVTSEMSPNIADGFEFGDYNGLDIVGNDLIAIFTDNRNEGGGTSDSADVYAAGQTLDGGGLIFADGFESGETVRWSAVAP